jgi:hypothetical protein
MCRNFKIRIIRQRRREVKTKLRKNNPITNLYSFEGFRRMKLPDF